MNPGGKLGGVPGGAAVEEMEVGGEFELGGKTVKITTEQDLAMFRNGQEEGEPLAQVMKGLKSTYGDERGLLDEASLRDKLIDPAHIAKLMAGETRPEVYLVVRSSEEGGSGYTRILLRKEGNNYKVQDEPFSHKDSAKLQPKDKLVVAEGGPAGIR